MQEPLCGLFLGGRRSGGMFLCFEVLDDLTEGAVGESAGCVMRDAGVGADDDEAR